MSTTKIKEDTKCRRRAKNLTRTCFNTDATDGGDIIPRLLNITCGGAIESGITGRTLNTMSRSFGTAVNERGDKQHTKGNTY